MAKKKRPYMRAAKVPAQCKHREFYLGEKGCYRCDRDMAGLELLEGGLTTSPGECPDFIPGIEVETRYYRPPLWRGEDRPLSAQVTTGGGWEVEHEKAHCEKKGVIYLSYLVHHKIQVMTKAMEHSEWLGYLIGGEVTDGFNINELVVPKQTVSAARVEVKETPIRGDILGTVHSHGYSAYSNSAPGFSSIDEQYVQANHPVTLLTSGNGQYTYKVRRKMVCGIWIEVEPSLVIVYPAPEGMEQFLTEAKAQCEKSVFTTVMGYGYHYLGKNQQPGFDSLDMLGF